MYSDAYRQDAISKNKKRSNMLYNIKIILCRFDYVLIKLFCIFVASSQGEIVQGNNRVQIPNLSHDACNRFLWACRAKATFISGFFDGQFYSLQCILFVQIYENRILRI